ncbi:MAG: transglycosylase SLT domain-containing protein [bacterium]
MTEIIIRMLILIIPNSVLLFALIFTGCVKNDQVEQQIIRTAKIEGIQLSASEDTSEMDIERLMKREEDLNTFFPLIYKGGKISRYDRIIKKYARRYRFDWRFIAAQIHAESSFRPDVLSPAGAVGLMQIMPSTAEWLKKSPKLLLHPEENIALGVYYDRWIFNLWKDIRGTDRLAFTMASYNAGRVRVLKAQKKAGQAKKWTHVYKHLPQETQKYVPKIFEKYVNYKKMVP